MGLRVLVTCIVGVILMLSLTSSVLADTILPLPSVSDNTEIEYWGYKYSNFSGFITTTKNEISCNWNRTTNKKDCESIFYLEKTNPLVTSVNSPTINSLFKGKSTYENVRYLFSNTYNQSQVVVGYEEDGET